MMKKFEYNSRGVEETLAFGQKLAQYFKAGDIICLFGELGSGKTTLAKGIAQGLKVNPTKVNSPTFVLMNEYHGRLPLFHFDFYRLEEQKEISLIGCEEFFYGPGVSVIEWPERLGELLPKECLHIQLSVKGETLRAFTIKAVGDRYKEYLGKFKV